MRLDTKEVFVAPSRRQFLKTAAAAGTFACAPLAAQAAQSSNEAVSTGQILDCFRSLPGDVALHIYAPPAGDNSQLLIQANSGKMLFVASAIKTYVLCEALRQADSPEVAHTLEQKDLALNDTVWSLGSPTFDPPNLSGTVSELTAMEAMITRSDNTATDMLLKLAGADNVRDFVAQAGLKNTLVPDSTRALTGYVFGAPNYKTISWEELLQVIEGPPVHPFLNKVETLASSADDLVSYYSRALQGNFFKYPETLVEFRRILTLCDFIYLVPLPLGVSAYVKSGNADAPGFHARCVAGGMYFPDRWVYFAFIINWYSHEPSDPGTVDEFFSAINRSLTQIRDSLSA
jgi:beta-lactamase class A